MHLLHAIVLLAVTATTVTNAHQDDNTASKPTSTLLRGSSSHKKAAQLFPISPSMSSIDPLSDFSRTGLDRSLAYIHYESELNLPQSQEVMDAMGEYITMYSPDGNDDNSGVCNFDYEGDVDPYAPTQQEMDTRRALLQDWGRALQDMDGHTMDDMGHSHSEHDYVESTCNAMLDMATCINWTEYFDSSSSVSVQEAPLEPLEDYLLSEVKIPCGVCVILDAAPGQDLYGAKLEFGEGLNIVGKLIIPNNAKIELRTKYVYVQGVLAMPEPASGSSTGLPSDVEGDRVVITLWGLEDLMFKADAETNNTHLGEEGVHNKAIVVAGGRLDIHAMDPTCPSWVKLQSIQYGVALPNVALNKPATQSSTYNNMQHATALKVVDGDDATYSHTMCSEGYQQWWQVDLEDMYTIVSLEIVNRLDCCGGRLHDYDTYFMDENMTVVDGIYIAGHNGDRKTFSTNQVNARYVKIQLRDQDCLQLGEVKIHGYPASETFPSESLDTLTVGEDAARCWQTKGSRIMLTSDTYGWSDSQTATVESSPSPGKIAVLPLPKKKTAVDETFGHSDFAVEVALLDRSFVFTGEKETGDHEKIGGHLIVLHTPMVAQHLEGAMFTNFGQQTRLGRYPLHFHMSECVHGSTLAKNVIWKSNQRCIVIHGTHNVTLSENVAYDTRGHCFMLEDGGEWHNIFYRNLGALTKAPVSFNNRAGTIRPEETDNFPATFWITNPTNDFIDNVAAGSASTGFWFELKLRAPSSDLPINQGMSPKTNAQGKFEGNAAHSNNFRAGFTTYETGYRAPPGTMWKNIKSYKNNGAGLFQHGTNNIIMQGGLLADNAQAARNFHHEWAVYDGVEVIGRSEHVQSLIDQGRINEDCGKAGGVSIQPNEGLGHGTTIKNSRFSGFDVCTGSKNVPIWVENDQVRNAVFDAAPTIVNNTYEPQDRRIDACSSINSSVDGKVRLIAIEDDGSMSGAPGFYVQNEVAITNFIDESSCQDEEGCLRFCPGACLRLGIVAVSQALTTRGFTMHIQDGDKSGTVPRGSIWFDELQNHLNAQIPFQLPAPADKYHISFTDGNEDPAWPGYVKLSLEREPACSGALVDESQVEFVMPPSARGACDNLFSDDNYSLGIHGWQNFFAGIEVTQDEGGSYVISTKRRKNDRGHVNLSRTLDASCFPGHGGRKYTLFGKIRMTDADGNHVATDGTSNASPKVSLHLDGVKSWAWNIATSSDGTWSVWSQDVILPEDTRDVWKARIVIDQAEKKEFHIKDWGMTLVPSDAPTTSPTDSPSTSPTRSPTASPSTPLPTVSPTTSTSPTPSPTQNPTPTPITAAPVSATPTNLALAGLASANTECHNQFARNAIDGVYTNRYEGCNTAGSFLMVDMGKDTLNHIDTVVIKNRCDCCGGRLKKFHVEVLDAQKNVVWSTYHDPWVPNCQVLTFLVNGEEGAVGRWVRLRYDESYIGILHITEMEVWGYPVELPANKPDIVEMALNRPATQSSIYGNGFASKGNDGDFGNAFHTQCGAHPWWEVDLGVESFVQDVWITNRVNCCGGRLRDALVELLDSDHNVVESRTIKGAVGNGKLVQKVFNEETSFGRYIKISMARNECLHLTEVQVSGYPTMAMPSASPTPSLVNLSVHKPATQSSTYNNMQHATALKVVDEDDATYSHTMCWQGYQQWWQVDLETSDHTIVSMEIVNRLDCCGGRLHDYRIDFHDENGVEVDSILVPGPNHNMKIIPIDRVQGARYVKLTLGDQDCLQLGEVKVMGWYN